MRADREPKEEPDLDFEWDREKAERNLSKHGISFHEATTVFGDGLSVMVSDLDHSSGEIRYLDIGMWSDRRLLVVAYTERGSKIRIISCRRATRSERQVYEEQE